VSKGQAGSLPEETRVALKGFLLNLSLTVFSLLLLMGGGFAVLEIWMRSAPPEVEVPNLVGVDVAQARILTQKSGLRFELVGEEQNSSYPENSVSWMYPPAGKVVREGRTVQVRVSVPIKVVTVPKLIGMSLEAARDALLERNLVGKEDKKVPSLEVTEGTVAVQSPTAGSRVAEGAVVRLFPSAGMFPARQEGRPKKALNEVSVEVPSDGQEHQVRIVVEDDYGSRDYYRGRHQSGETVTETVESYGPAMVEVYLDGHLEARQPLR
jgi:serine/threonine-protein kinase